MRYVPTWLPGAGILRRAKQAKIMIDRVVEEPYQQVKVQRVSPMVYTYNWVPPTAYRPQQKSDRLQRCFLDNLLDDYEKAGTEDERQELLIKSAAAQIYVGMHLSLYCLVRWSC